MAIKRSLKLKTIEKNDLFDYPNRYIFQEKDGFKFSLDSILLAEFVKLKKGATILDMCTGNAPIPLILSTKTGSKIIGFEIQKEIFDLANQSVKINNLESQIQIINEDIKNINKIFPGKYFDIITCNPPYFPFHNNPNGQNKNDLKTIARHEMLINLDDILCIVQQVLKDNGIFYLVHRLNRLDEIILTADKYGLKIKEMQIICTNEYTPKIVLLKIVKHQARGIKINKIIDVHNLTSYQHLFEEE